MVTRRLSGQDQTLSDRDRTAADQGQTPSDLAERTGETTREARISTLLMMISLPTVSQPPISAAPWRASSRASTAMGVGFA
jgi:hypothetical protein